MTATNTSSSSTTAASCAATRCSSPPAGARASTGIGLETVGIEADPRGVPVDSHLRAGERLWAIGDVTGLWPLTHVGKYQGRRRRRQPPRRAARGQLRRRPAGHLHRPAGRRGRRHRGRIQRDRAPGGGRQDGDLHTRLRRVQRLPDAAQRRRAPDRRARARARGRRVAPAGHARDPRPRAARRPARHDPAVPDVLGDLRRRAQGAAQRGLRPRGRGVTQWEPPRTVSQERQVMRRITRVIARPISGSAIGTPSATTAAEATTASET